MKKFIKENLVKIIFIIVLVFSFAFNISSVYAVHVNGYYRSNGTYVNGYERTAPDGNPYNNYSYPGNYNPNTGGITGGNPSTYLYNYYNKPSSGYSSGYSYPSYTSSYTTTPSCPLMSSYDSISGGCTCYSGYVSDGTSCISGSLACYKKIGLMSQYNSISKNCECMSGYILDGSACIYLTQSCQKQFGINSYSSSADMCKCNAGYEWSADRKSCIQSLVCGINEVKSGNECVTPNQVCQSNYGLNSKSSNQTFDLTGNTSCVCSDNYQWSIDGKSCIVKPVIISTPINNKITFTKNLQLGSSGSDVKQLQIKLGVTSPNGYFGQKTLSAVKAFQLANKLIPSGIVDSVMMKMINN